MERGGRFEVEVLIKGRGVVSCERCSGGRQRVLLGASGSQVLGVWSLGRARPGNGGRRSKLIQEKKLKAEVE